MTGRSRLRRDCGWRSYHERRNARHSSVGRAEKTQWITRKGRTTAGGSRGGTSSARTLSVVSLAPRLASTSARAAAPSRARRTGSRHQADDGVFELARGAHLDGGAVGEKRARRSRRSSPCADRTRSACRERPARGCCGRRAARGFRRRIPPWRSDRAAPARQSCRASPRRREARRRSATRCGESSTALPR